jgi:hypothetical protein
MLPMHAQPNRDGDDRERQALYIVVAALTDAIDVLPRRHESELRGCLLDIRQVFKARLGDRGPRARRAEGES